jgi:hypothetical protein
VVVTALGSSTESASRLTRARLVAGLALAIVLGASSVARAQTCPNLFADIRKEAAYCGFFCDDARLEAMQARYEASCITFVAAPSPLEPQPPAWTWPLSCRRTDAADHLAYAGFLRPQTH